jgi:alpha-N-arabinofuranosidase
MKAKIPSLTEVLRFVVPPQRLAALVATFVATLGAFQVQADDAVPLLEIQVDKPGPKVSPMLYGLMTEEINYSYDGGLYGELVRNRTFKESAQEPRRWRLIEQGGGTGAMSLDTNQPVNSALTTSLRLDAAQVSGKQKVGIANEGYWGIPVLPRTRYRASFYARASEGFSGPLTVALVSDGSNATVYASATVRHVSGQWKKHEVTFTTGKVPRSKENHLEIWTSKPGTIWFSQVSLFPPTWNDRPNGNRRDIMDLLVEMKPAFLRFPGGNYLEGNWFTNRFDWKKTVGDISQRPGHRNDAWGYWSTDGLGLLEYLEWCEDMRAQPVLAVYGAYSMRQGGMTNQLGDCVQDALDEIEYVTGPANTKWGAQRARDGHPAPFKLEYVEIGNEDNLGSGWRTYDSRFTAFYDAIKSKYPELKIISTATSSTNIVVSRVPDVIDDHYYRSPQQMQQMAGLYDHYDRSKPKIFVGEYAAQSPGTNRQLTPHLGDALGDAAFLTGLERNSDVVIMSCYAPLFVNVNRGGAQWRTDLIGYNALASYGSPSYYVQRMFNLYRGDVVLPVWSADVPTQKWQPPPGRRGGVPPAPVNLPTLFFVATRDSKAGAIYLKLVNTASNAQPIRVMSKGVKSIAKKGQVIVLASDNYTDTNSIDNPTRITPVNATVRDFSADFTRTLPPFSVTILRMQPR